MLLVFYFHFVAARGVAGYYFGTGELEAPIARSVFDVIIINGFTGVSLFFVLSGFIFTWGALQSDKINWKGFYINRILRILPLFLLVNLIAVGFGGMPLAQLPQNLLGFGNFRLGYGNWDIVLWTISLEIQFYMLFPFLFTLMRKRGVIWIVGIIALMIGLRLAVRLDGAYLHDPVYWTMFGRIDQFLIGMVLAWVAKMMGWLNGGVYRPTKLAAGLVASVTALIALQWIYLSSGWKYGESFLQIIWPTTEGLAWAAVGIFYVGLVRRLQPKWIGPLTFIGVISFSLYLLQYPIIKILQQAEWVVVLPNSKVAAGVISATFIALPITIIASTITYNLIEKPPLKLRKRYTS